MTVEERIQKVENENGGWFGNVLDINDALKEENLDVLEINAEYAVVTDEDDEDEQYLIRFGGTTRTIIIASVERI